MNIKKSIITALAVIIPSFGFAEDDRYHDENSWMKTLIYSGAQLELGQVARSNPFFRWLPQQGHGRVPHRVGLLFVRRSVFAGGFAAQF